MKQAWSKTKGLNSHANFHCFGVVRSEEIVGFKFNSFSSIISDIKH